MKLDFDRAGGRADRDGMYGSAVRVLGPPANRAGNLAGRGDLAGRESGPLPAKVSPKRASGIEKAATWDDRKQR
jgi:hypothetical protein